MKITVEIDATPQEVREFFGLPDVQPLQNEILHKLQQEMANGTTGFDAINLMKPILPAHMQSLEAMQNAFWSAFNSAKPTDSKKRGSTSGKDK